MSQKKHRVFLVDDHPIVRQGIALLINQTRDLMVCGTASDTRSAMEAVPKSAPDIVVTDLSMPGPDGLELIKNLRTLMPTLSILVLSMQDEMLYAGRALKSGARGYIMKHEAEENILAAIQRVLAGQIYLSPSMTSHFLQNATTHAEVNPSPLDLLSDRELQVFELLGNGVRTSKIAEQLGIGVKTVETHIVRIRHKLGFADSHEMSRQAVIWVQRKLPKK